MGVLLAAAVLAMVQGPPQPTPPSVRVRPKPNVAAAPNEASAKFPRLGLRRSADGSYAYVDPHGRFTAVVYPNGSVAFADRWRRVSASDVQNGALGGLPAHLIDLNRLCLKTSSEAEAVGH